MAPPGNAQQGPIRLFPERAAPSAVEPVPEQIRPVLPGPGGPPVAPRPERTAPAEPPRRFVVEGLAAPELDAIGLSGPAEGGFDRSLWQGSDPELVRQLLADLPVATRVPPLRRLAQRLLVSGAPVGGREPGQLLALRIERLVAMGDLDGARALVERVPPLSADSVLARRAAEVDLLLGDDTAACRFADSLAPTTRAEFWAEIAVYCRLVEDDRDGARLALDLMREAGQTADAAFFALATAMVDQTGPPPPGGARRTDADPPALLALAKWPLPPDAAHARRATGAGRRGARAGARRRAAVGDARAGVSGRRDCGRSRGGRLCRAGLPRLLASAVGCEPLGCRGAGDRLCRRARAERSGGARRALGCSLAGGAAAPSASSSPRCSRSRSWSCRSSGSSRAWRRAWRGRCSRPSGRFRRSAGCRC